MQEGFPNETNPQAELGNAVHELDETCLLTGWDAVDFIGRKFNGFVVDEQMAEAAQMHVNYVRSLMASRPNAKLLIEKRVWLKSISEDDLWGTGDIVIIDYDSRTLFVIDYKNGYGIVEVDKPIFVQAQGKVMNGNAQCVGYALAALDTYNLWQSIDKVVTGIVQPNVEHKDGYIRTKEYNMRDMLDWWHSYETTYRLIKSGGAPTAAGKHCKYCKAAGVCRSRIDRTMEMLQLEDGLDHLLPTQIIDLLNEADTIRYSLDALEAQAVKLARQGQAIPYRKLVKSTPRAKLKDEDALVAAAKEKGLDTSKLYNKPKVKGKSVIAKIDSDLAEQHFETPSSTLTLVPIWDKRVAVAPDERPDAAKAFEGVELPKV